MIKWWGMFKFWLRLRRANKRLLKDVEAHRNDPKYAPPTRAEVLEFANSNGPFYHDLSPIPRPKYYKFPKD